jgi:hypothetical protein
MLQRVARFSDLQGSDGGLPDSRMPSAERKLYNVIGFQPPKNSGGAVTSPVGDVAAKLAAIKISEGFNTNETFIPMTGTWRCSWENEEGAVEHVDLGPLDVVSFPPGVARRFENVTAGNPEEEAILMFVIAGDGPRAEFTDEAMQEIQEAGVLTPRPA